jgi:hypothetical protein
MSPLADALMVIVGAIGPGGLLVLCVAVLMLQLTDTIGDALDDRRDRRDRAAAHRPVAE